MVLLDGVGESEHAAKDAEADEADGGARDDEEDAEGEGPLARSREVPDELGVPR